jgi:signal transduction histidine kinase
MAVDEVQRLSVLVSQLREVYRPRTVGIRQQVDLVDVLSQVKLLVTHQMEDARVQWLQELPKDKVIVEGVADQLKQVFLNICSNAIDAMATKGGQLNIKFSTDLTGKVGTSFQDTGPGISPENLSRLFEPLFTTKAKGLGLGLSISLDIVRAHGGQITVDSQVGIGTTFTVWLPLTGSSDPRETGEEGQ